ncbi:regulatory protein, luxR family [Selenomonas ruminantium]|uniref:Regulatory protein, luxR family n=2 Tax=Selenomonas ruminantium TaxID=971 RepID=A0A1H0UDE8_SELRU|nr:regulatory protein, luxR family [Selenomonas ruminantium]
MIMMASVEEFRETVFEVISEMAPFDCGISYVVKNDQNEKHCLEPIAYTKAAVVPDRILIERAAELAHKSSVYCALEWQKKSIVFRDSDMFNDTFLSQTDIGRLVHDELGMSYACKIFMVHKGLLLGKFWLLRRKESGNFTDKELFCMRLLEPMIMRRMYEFHPQSERGAYARRVLRERFGLTEREREITALICRGMSNRQIADKLICAEATVKKHVSAIAKKMGESNRSGIIHRCVMEKAVLNYV